MEYIIVSLAMWHPQPSNKSDAVQLWRAGKDHKLYAVGNTPHNTYCSNRDFEAGTKVEIRYDHNRKVVFVDN